MRIEVLHVEDCPGTRMLLDRLAALTDVPVETRLVRDEREAVAFGMTGSPTMLVDGVDPFGDGQAPSLACRLYRVERGKTAGLPSVAALLAVLRADWRFSGTSARSRRLPAEPHALHRSILADFLSTGRAPDRAALRASGATDEALDRLRAEDLVLLDAEGGVEVAYPFSGRPTEHRVRPAGLPPVFAMCAIDALGIPLMAGRDAVIDSVDAVTGAPVRVELAGGVWRWEPVGTVVLVARSAGSGPTSCCACPHMNFHVSPETARSYLDKHGLAGEVLDQPTAVELSEMCFGTLLAA